MPLSLCTMHWICTGLVAIQPGSAKIAIGVRVLVVLFGSVVALFLDFERLCLKGCLACGRESFCSYHRHRKEEIL